jgi:hypothetical protein
MATPAQRLLDLREKYPGMAPREAIIFRQWMLAHGAEYDRFEYNVRVGTGTDPGPKYPESIRNEYILNTQKRIDAVGFKGAQPTIIEVKDRATASCMSQLLTYKALWPVTFPNTPAPILLLVTNRVSADMPFVLAQNNIQYADVPADFSILARNTAPPAPGV